MLAVPARRDSENANTVLDAIGNNSDLPTATACRLGRRGCKEQRQHQSSNREQAAHETQGQDFRTISHERSNGGRQVLISR
jgi:hypothetical protein